MYVISRAADAFQPEVAITVLARRRPAGAGCHVSEPTKISAAGRGREAEFGDTLGHGRHDDLDPPQGDEFAVEFVAAQHEAGGLS